ncbi:hypothetical protein S40285_02675 [Stachybotrys chlorohalonatus IBT 40285]|uniref:Zn(2)-C6 fungal-type domain-containing protein n=1 Tax=Stachybotrys chlorohalonatus (strain IBT 40285) TaxID=1283841 RepID=A0A084QMU3_STAC4|nr:hypothetical protein S40285_02675 [Stachybotrys chlorohalonata IBT 40285]
MGPNRDGEPDEANNISYPSPGAETMDAGPFYHTGTRDGAPDADQQDQHVPDQVHVEDHDHPDLQHHEAETPQQHASRPPNLEELQLAAQLGQGLAGTPLLAATGPNMNVEDPGLRTIMPHPEPEQHHTPSYVHDTPVSDPMAQHSMPVPVGPSIPPQYSVDDGIPPRKRSKVSRACDECRRKKIKCDAQSDTGEVPCGSCARSSCPCLFSRVPQKRGPSKGYIKELADRIVNIEQKLVNDSEAAMGHDELERLFAPERSRGPNNSVPAEDANRKRPFSSISSGDFSTPAATRQTPWGSESRLMQPPSASIETTFATGSFGNSSLAPQPAALKVDEVSSKQDMLSTDINMAGNEEIQELDEGLLHEYLNHIQPVYPILANSKERTVSLLEHCPQSIRNAFLTALLSAVQPQDGDVKRASALLAEWESSENPRSRAINIVHAQTLLLLIIDADWRASPSLPFLLARAVALANTMKLWHSASVEPPSEIDSEDELGVRIWFSLVLMDRWYAAGTGRPALIPDSSVVIPPGLVETVGETCFHLIRLSKTQSKIAFVISTLPPGAATPIEPLTGILIDYIENWREDLPAHVLSTSHTVVHLAYWHCRLLISLLNSTAVAAETLWPTKELASLISANEHLRSPLINHFVLLVALSLNKLYRREDAREEASQVMKEIVENPAGVWDSVREKLTELMRPTSSAEAAASQGLQHLADLATAHEGIPVPEDEAAFGPSLALGYLEAV